jgi:hypothetical protein
MQKLTYTVTGLAESIESPEQSATEIIRMLRHYSGEALLMPIGDVNTGTGNKRLYPNDAPLRAAILMTLNQFGIPIGVLKPAFKGFDRYLALEFGTGDLTEACKTLKAPCLFIMPPDEGTTKTQRRVHLREVSDFEQMAARPLVALFLLPIMDKIKKPRNPDPKKPIIHLNPKKRIKLG